MGLTPVPDGEIGTVVTYLEMTERPALHPRESQLRLKRWNATDSDAYRALFRAVGGKWLWYSRLAIDEAELRRRLGEVHVVRRDGAAVGFVELDFRKAGECLIQFLGLVPELAGRGHGGWLFCETLALAWRAGVRRVHVHTCTLDHPAALSAYLKAGFRVYAQAFESFADPRLTGLLPADVAPQIPLACSRASCS